MLMNLFDFDVVAPIHYLLLLIQHLVTIATLRRCDTTLRSCITTYKEKERKRNISKVCGAATQRCQCSGTTLLTII